MHLCEREVSPAMEPVIQYAIDLRFVLRTGEGNSLRNRHFWHEQACSRDLHARSLCVEVSDNNRARAMAVLESAVALASRDCMTEKARSHETQLACVCNAGDTCSVTSFALLLVLACKSTAYAKFLNRFPVVAFFLGL